MTELLLRVMGIDNLSVCELTAALYFSFYRMMFLLTHYQLDQLGHLL